MFDGYCDDFPNERNIPMTISSYHLGSDSMQIKWHSGQASIFSYFWLRDNARDPVSFDSQSHQRELFTAMVPADISPEQVKLQEAGQFICIKWPDLENFVDYDSGFLAAYLNPADKIDVPAPTLWDAHNINSELVSIEFDQALSPSGTSETLKKLADYGCALVKKCPCEQASVAKFANNIGYIRETIFGGLWEFEANEKMADSAYTPKELRPHTDSTYSLDAPGLQILLCMEYDATGGDSIMVDGFRVAHQLQQDDPSLYAALGQIEVTGIYKGDGSNLQARRPILRHDHEGRLIQVTFNNYDRAPMRLAEPQMTQLYSGIRYLDTLFNSSNFQWRYQLEPGEMLVFDNWRLLHGRGAFHGKRRMAGAYLNREDYLSALREHNLIN